jgi:glucokinase
MKQHFVAVDIGGSKISTLARRVGSDRDVFGEKLKTPAKGGVEAVLRLLDEQIDKLAGGRDGLKALGVAVPGHVDDAGHVLWAGNLDGWVDVPLRGILEERYEVPVYVERDANCAALGEKWTGAAKAMNDFVFLALGTGIGAGLFLNGRLYRGAHFAAGEVGNMRLFSGKAEGGPAVSEIVGKRAIKRDAERATGRRMSAAEALEQAAEKRRLRRATRKVVEYLSASVMAISSVLDPEAILFGGGTSEAGEALLGRIRKRVAPLFGTRLIRAGLGTDSQLYGALWGALKVAEGRLPEAGKGASPNFEKRASRRLIRAKRSERSKGDRSPRRQKR